MQATTEAPKMIVNVAVLAGDRTLLVRYSDRPDHQKGWFVPHAVVAPRAHPAEVAAEALQSQLGIAGVTPQLRDVDSFVGQDGTWHVPLTFVADDAGLSSEEAALTLGDEILAARWFPLAALPPRREVAHGGWALDLLATCQVARPLPGSPLF